MYTYYIYIELIKFYLPKLNKIDVKANKNK